VHSQSQTGTRFIAQNQPIGAMQDSIEVVSFVQKRNGLFINEQSTSASMH